jgi:hypothetical protein
VGEATALRLPGGWTALRIAAILDAGTRWRGFDRGIWWSVPGKQQEGQKKRRGSCRAGGPGTAAHPGVQARCLSQARSPGARSARRCLRELRHEMFESGRE